MSKDATALAREHTEVAIAALADIVTDPHMAKASEVIAAANALLDRGHGKPMQSIMAISATADELLTSMSDGELLAAIGEYRIAQRARLPAIESEVVTDSDYIDPLAL